MKRKICLFLTAVMLAGCSAENREMKQGLQLRSDLLAAQACSFSAEITADYGDAMHTFSVECRGTDTGAIHFTVAAPESVAGISGEITDSGGALKFDSTVLYFPLLTEDQLNPISAPWIFLKTLRSGYITSACREGELLRLTVNDSYEEDALTLDIWADGDLRPERADILYGGKRILSLEVTDFTIL